MLSRDQTATRNSPVAEPPPKAIGINSACSLYTNQTWPNSQKKLLKPRNQQHSEKKHMFICITVNHLTIVSSTQENKGKNPLIPPARNKSLPGMRLEHDRGLYRGQGGSFQTSWRGRSDTRWTSSSHPTTHIF